MFRRFGLIAAAASLAALAVVAAASARPAALSGSASSAASCGTVQIGMLAPITGPAGSIGADQLHWAQFFVAQWNKAGNKPKLKLVQGDTQLDPAKASTVAQSFASNASIMGVIGPAGSDEVQAVAPILQKAGLAFASGSATRVSLTNGQYKGYFFRDVPNDGVQGPTDGNYMATKLGVKSGDTVMIVDDQESYSTGLADIVGASLAAKGIKVDRESISQKDTDFSALVAKAGSAKVVFLPFQLASQAQLFAQQLKAQGKSAVVFGSDGTFDSSKFNFPGCVRLVLRSGCDDDREERQARRALQEGLRRRDDAVRCTELRPRAGLRVRDPEGVQGQEDHPRRGAEGSFQGHPEDDDLRYPGQVHRQR